MRLRQFFILTVVLLLSLPVAELAALDRDLHAARREALLSRLADDAAAIIPGATEQDLETFRQSNNFYYLTGIEQPNLLLMLSPRARTPVSLFLPARNLDQGSLSEAWTGEKLGPGPETEKLTGIPALERGTFEESFARLAADLKTLYYDWQPSSLDGPVSVGEVLLRRIVERCPHLAILPLSRLIDSLRVIKDSTEIALLERAVEITGLSLRETIPRIKPGMYEYEVEALIEYGFRSRGGRRPGFPSIVGSGPNSTVLHYNLNRRLIEPGELVLMDVGAEFEYYTADITRTVPADGKFSPRQREVYSIVLQALKAATAAVKPGVSLRDVHKAAMDVIEKAGYGRYFIHYTSHFLGMDVHDVGSRDMTLAPGMVITVEPGVYIPEEKLGVRIEDDVLVTPDGCRVLSSDIPREITEIENLMRSH